MDNYIINDNKKEHLFILYKVKTLQPYSLKSSRMYFTDTKNIWNYEIFHGDSITGDLWPFSTF